MTVLRCTVLTLWVGGMAGSYPAAAESAAGAALPVRKVALFSSGVGYFEHHGSVEGDDRAELRFRAAQINDLLKSLVLLDLDGGRIGTVVYPSHDPLSKTLASFQVDLSGDPGLAALLGQLRGSAVTLQAQGRQLEGRILGVEQRRKHIEGDVFVEGWVLNLVADGSLRAVALDDVQDIRLQEAELQEELDQALAALAQARDQDDKPIMLEFRGQGRRRVRVAYVVEAPVWKTSYRLILGHGPGSAHLQGWAIVENQTDQDWDDVELSLVSGRPMSFVQELYEPRYVTRPTVQPLAYAGVPPQRYEAGARFKDDDMADRKARRRRAPRAAPAPLADAEFGASAGTLIELGKAMASVQAAASGGRMGELFAYQVGSVSLPRQRSSMIPIVSEAVEVERMSIYNAGVLAERPLVGVRLVNSTSNHLLAGPISVYDGEGYAGDASVEDVPPGQQRLLTFAIDLEMAVRVEPQVHDGVLVSGKIVRGVLHTQRRYRESRAYHVDNRGERGKRLLIEHPVRQQWTLVDTPRPREQTATLYRFELELGSGHTEKLEVHEEFLASETVVLWDGDPDMLAAFQQSRGMPATVREALADVIERRRKLAVTQQGIQRARKELQDITAEQDRIRANLGSVARGSDYHNRLLSKLDDQETRIEAIQEKMRDLLAVQSRQQAELEDHLAELSLP